MNFLEQLRRQISSYNNNAAENGDYVAVTLLSIDDWTSIIEFIDLSCDTSVRAYAVKIHELEGPYTKAMAELMRTDSEVPFDHWPPHERTIADVGIRVPAHV